MATRITRRDATLRGAHRPRHRHHNDGSAASCHFGSTEPCHPTEIEQVLTRFGFGNLVGRPSEVCGGLADGAEVHLLRTFGETGPLQILVHTLAKSGAHQWVLSKRRVEKPSGNPLCHRHNRPSPEPWRLTKTGEPAPHRQGKASRSSCRDSGLLEPLTGSDPFDRI
jgi:hypothetical protein